MTMIAGNRQEFYAESIYGDKHVKLLITVPHISISFRENGAGGGWVKREKLYSIKEDWGSKRGGN